MQAQIARSGIEVASGILDILPEGYGFLRRAGYYIGNDDIYVSQSQIRRFELRRGDMVEGQARRPKESEKYYGLIRVDKVNGLDPEAIKGRRNFEKGTPIYPQERFKLEVRSTQLSTRVIDLFSPIGKGQRALIVSPPKAGKTTLLKNIANSISINHPDAHIIALLVDERPEEVTDMQRTIDGEVVASTFDEHPENHTTVAELDDGTREASRRARQRRRDPARLDHASRARLQPGRHELGTYALGRSRHGVAAQAEALLRRGAQDRRRRLADDHRNRADRNRLQDGRRDLRRVQRHRQHGDST